MKTKFRFLVLIFSTVIFFSSCIKKSNEITKSNNGIVTITIKPDSNQLDLAKYFKSYSLIQFNNNVIFGSIGSVFEENGKLVIKGNSEDYKIFTLDLNNSDLKKIAKLGKGPGEFLNIKWLEYYNNRFGVLDYWKKSITNYNMYTNEIIDTVVLPSHYEAFAYIDSKHTVLYKDVPQDRDKNTEYNISILNNNSETISKSFFAIDEVISMERSISNSYKFYHYYDTLIYFKSFRDTIYNIYSDSLEPRYILDQGKYKFPDELYWNKKYDLNDFMQLCIEGNYIRNVDNFYENEDIIFFTFIYKNKFYYNFYNKNTGLSEASCNIKDKLFFKSVIPLSEEYAGIIPVGGNNKCIYFKVEPYYVKLKIDEWRENIKLEEWNEFKDNNVELINIYSSSSIEDNPIILKYEFK